MFELIVALTPNLVIGKDNTIPWYVTEDLQLFKKLTSQNIIIMGRKTYESLPKKPLPNRCNIVLTSNPDKYNNEENLIFTTEEQLMNKVTEQKDRWGERIFVLGGNEIYKRLFDKCNKLHITIIDKQITGDIYFPFTFNEIVNKYGYTLKKTSSKILSKTDNVLFQFQTYVK